MTYFPTNNPLVDPESRSHDFFFFNLFTSSISKERDRQRKKCIPYRVGNAVSTSTLANSRSRIFMYPRSETSLESRIFPFVGQPLRALGLTTEPPFSPDFTIVQIINTWISKYSVTQSNIK